MHFAPGFAQKPNRRGVYPFRRRFRPANDTGRGKRPEEAIGRQCSNDQDSASSRPPKAAGGDGNRVFRVRGAQRSAVLRSKEMTQSM